MFVKVTLTNPKGMKIWFLASEIRSIEKSADNLIETVITTKTAVGGPKGINYISFPVLETQEEVAYAVSRAVKTGDPQTCGKPGEGAPPSKLLTKN